MLDSCLMPELLAEITMQPVRRHDVDAAILFSDIVVPLKAAGVDLDIVPGRGPVVAEPIRTEQQVQDLPILQHDISKVAAGIKLIREELAPEKALIGFVGGPFTLASYLVEGGPSKNHEHTKALMRSNPQLWHQLMQRLVPSLVQYLETQIVAGIQAWQLFDSWAGFLSPRDYEEFVLPYSKQLFAAAASVPRLHFGVGTGQLLPLMAQAGSEVVGVDWRVPLDVAARRIHAGSGRSVVLQGNLDPALLFAPDDVITAEIGVIAAEAQKAQEQGHARGHIFNLGHGVLPNTQPEQITLAVQKIHELPVAG